MKDKAYRFLQTIRGTPPYWQKAMYKLLAAVKQLGIFTFFVTLSAADMKWTDTIIVITRQQGKSMSKEEVGKLTWEEKCGIWRSNPVTAARHFDHRFNYPKPPSSETIIAQPSDFHNPNKAKLALESAAFIKSSVIEKLETKDYTSLNHLLKDSNISHQEYKSALELSKRGKLIIYKRNQTEIQINSYNKHLLRAWEANLDVQYCLDPYACIAYMVAYITKDEREMSQILQAVSNEANTLDFKSSMKNSNFSTVYVPADKPEKRICLLKPISSVKDKEDEDEDVYQTSILDRYAARPTKLENLSEDNTASSTITLKNELGQMQKTKKPAILKYHKYSEMKEKEDYCYSQLLLYMPWRNKHEDLNKFDMYEELYDNVFDIIDSNRQDLEHHADIIEEALDQFESVGPPEHSWDTIAPQVEQENAEQSKEGAIEDENFSTLNTEDKQKQKPVICNTVPVGMAVELRSLFLTDEDYRERIRSLNAKQRDIFQIVLQCCENLAHMDIAKKKSDPLRIFISGGAGTGKSHLISCINQMALRKLQTIGDNPDDVHVLLTAPTGTAAHNISGVTLHSAFLLPLGQTKSYIKLSDDKRNAFRSKASKIRLLIIDEISMVGSELLLQIHYRLCEITGINEPFGVDQHNTKMLSTSKEPMEILKAIDKKPHDLKKINPKNDPRFTGGLPDEITVAVGAKIMLTRNVDVSDGLVNGAQGTIKMIIKRRNNSSTISNVVALLVQFDDANTGSNARKLSRFPVEKKQFSSATPITRSEISFTLSSKTKA
ncbi:unnamed protein product [Mytilus edulis]|uniref:ATP-dependent DNA helicase n=1 Tax=Mytilus edulis TaxID=6550 RepID=A0A8S3R0E4_MYTED|nr:unnamed protein product [Mytilus edulis]